MKRAIVARTNGQKSLFDFFGVQSLRDIHMICIRYICMLHAFIKTQICIIFVLLRKLLSISFLRKRSKTEEPLKLSDLNDDCLLEIFKDFSLIDLVNIVDCYEGVGNAARILFNKKFSKEEICVTNAFEQKYDECSYKLLKHFGSVISILRMEYSDAYRGVDYKFDELIVRKCRKSLKEITFVNAGFYTMNDISEPFEEVLKVTFVSSKFCDLIPNFEKWFPKAHTLLLVKQPRMAFKKRSMLENHIPVLKGFSIENSDDVKPEQLDEKVDNYNISTFIKLNPQLENLSIYCDQSRGPNEPLRDFDGIKMDHELLGTINSKLKNLKNLEIVFKKDAPQMWLPKIHFDELSILQIRFYTSTILDGFPVSTGKVNQLILTGFEMRPNILNFIEKQTNVRVLKLQGTWIRNQNRAAAYNNRLEHELDDEYVSLIIRLVPKLPYLSQLYISYQTPQFQPHEIFRLLESCIVLKKLVIQADDVLPMSKERVSNVLQSITEVPDGWTTQFHDDWDNFRRFGLVFTK